MTKTHVSLLALCLLLTTTISAQFNKLFTSDNGLPNSLVNDITQDTDGRLWIATENGLSCFNGSRFVNYRALKSDKHSLANNFIRRLCTGDDGQILLGTVDGVQIYNRYTDSFSEVASTESIGITTSNVNDIHRLHDGSYFVVGFDAYTIDVDDNIVPHVRRNAMTGVVTSIYDATEGRDGDIWCVCGNNGVWRVHKDHVVQVKDEAGRLYNFYSICVGNDGRIYGGHTESGLYVFNNRTNHFDLLPGTESLRTIRDMQPMPNTDILCIAMDGNGVRYYDTRKHSFVTFGRFYDPFVDISSQKVHSLYIDNEGNIWMALYQLGVYFASSRSESFGYFGHRSPKYDIIGDRCVTSIMESHDGSVWVSTDNGGLYGVTPQGTALRHFISDDSEKGLPTTLLGLFQDSRHRTWFGSFHRGSGIVDLNSGRCDYVPMQGVTDRIYSVYEYVEDKRGTIWAATMGHGIARYDEASHSFRIFSPNDDVQWSDCLFYDDVADNIYAGTYDGVVWFSAKGKGEQLTKVCNGNVVYSISRITKNLLAFCTTNGLIVFDTKSNTVSYTITMDDGLPDNNVLAAEMGNDGKLWISCSYGIVRYDLKSKTVEVFSVIEGLQGNEFYKNAALLSRDGRLWFGGINGVTVFSPRGIGKLQPQQCNICIDVYTNERLVPQNGDGVFVLPYGSNSFAIEFSTRPLYLSRRIIYYYKLDNGEWATLPMGQTRVTFNEISYGSHTLYMKTVIGGKETEVFKKDICVPYPWYLTWWAWLLWLTLAASFLYFVIFTLRRRHLLRQEVKKHKEEEAASEARLTFFTNVVHDLRTPLSLIVSPLQKLKQMDNDDIHRHLYGVMQKSADRLLHLSNEIIDLRKLNMGKMQLHCREVEISSFLTEIVDSVADLAEINSQQLDIVDHTDGEQTVWMDPVAIEKVMLNLLGNAIKYTPKNGSITTEWEIREQQLHVRVIDNGTGIPDSDKELVFKSFFQTEMASRYNYGTGLGLSLVRSLIDLHHGEIHVEDNPDERGTCMHFSIPAAPEAYTEEEKKAVEQDEPVAAFISEQPYTADIIEAADEERQEDAPKTSLRRRNILIADDEKDILEYISEELARTYNIIQCHNGKEAYDILLRLNNEKNEKRRIDLVISDVMMPETDGLELCRMIRKNVHLCHIPVILLTAKASEADHLQGLQASADAYVTKPFNMSVLEAVVSNILTRQDTMRIKYKGDILPVDSIETPEVKTVDDTFLEKLNMLINENIGNPDITSDFIAKEMGMSRVHMYRKLKELTNQSFTNYIRNIRLAKAAEMLSHGKVSVAEVATLVGFKSISHFSTAFRAVYGTTPTEYMK